MLKCLFCLLYYVSAIILVLFNSYIISMVPVVDSDGGNDQTGKKATCTLVECPALDCKKVIQEEGKCCKSCDTAGKVIAHTL